MPLLDQENSVFDNFELRLNEQSKKFLKETSQWTFILSILGFVYIGFMILGSVLFLFVMRQVPPSASPYGGEVVNIPPAALGLVYLVIAVLTFFPVLYLYKFSRKMRLALNLKSTEDLTTAFSNLRAHYRFVGILTIAMIALWILGIIIGIIYGVSAAS